MPSSISNSDSGAAGPRLTASDRPGIAQPVPERPVPDRPWRGIFAAAILLAMTLIGAWEWHWREFGAIPGYRDDNALWAIQRHRIDADAARATVLVGSSRNFSDVQLPMWEKLSGHRPIQLSIAGTSPMFAIEDLANDPVFKGRLLIDVAPDIFFTGSERPDIAGFLRHESPSERVGKWLSMHAVEPYFAFYDPDFALFKVIRRQNWRVRPGRDGGLQVRKLFNVDADRNALMWDKVERDPEYRALVKRIWAEDFNDPPPSAAELEDRKRTLDRQIARTVAAVEKMRARGVTIVFVRHPTSGEYLAYEDRDFPRRTTWDVLLARTGARGIHFRDYPSLQGFDPPEWSHLSAEDAPRYTQVLYQLLETQFTLPNGGHW